MAKQKKESYFWTSFSDLMTSLFFVMLVLFVLTIALLNRKMRATEEQLKKITEIEEAINRIDPVYFTYNDVYKKHILNTRVNFPIGVSDINTTDPNTKNELVKAGRAIQRSLEKIRLEHPDIKYLLIIEGQASRDRYPRNYELSYERALSLSRFWRDSGINFGDNAEVIIAGSGTGGTMRERRERLNQRFLIHIVPKPGIIEASKQIRADEI